MLLEWGTTLFLSMFIFLILGMIGSLFFIKKMNVSNWIAHVCAFIGSGLGLSTAIMVLLSGETINIQLWSISSYLDISFAVDPLSAFFLFIISLVSMVVAIFSIGYVTEFYGKKNIAMLGAGFNFFLLSMMAVITADTGFIFLFMWEVMSLVSFFLVIVEHEKQEVRKAGFIYVVMTHLGTVFIILSFLILFYFTGSFSFSAFHIGNTLPVEVKNLIFIMVLIGFGTKAGIIPLHIWLPKAHPAAPSHVSALMSAVMIKTALYGMIRFIYDFLGVGPVWWGGVILGIGLISAIVAILYGIVETDMKRFLAYSSAENMGVILVSFGTSLVFASYDMPVFAALALFASLYHALNHSVFKSLLFMGAGSVLFATHTKNIEKMGGIIRYMPWTAAFFLIGALSISAFPPFNGFISEWLTFQSLIHLSFQIDNMEWRLFGAIGVALLALVGALVAAGFVKFFSVAFLAMPRSENIKNAKEVPLSMRIAMGIMAVGTLLLGIFPSVVQNLIQSITRSYFPEGEMQTKGSLIFQPIPVEKLSISPSIVLLLLLVTGFICFIFLSLWVGKSNKVFGETWGCGNSLESSMQYTGASFSHPILIIFKSLLRPKFEEKSQGKKGYYSYKIHDAFEEFIYRPIVQIAVNLSKYIRRIQNGNIQTYLAYIFITLIVLLLWGK